MYMLNDWWTRPAFCRRISGDPCPDAGSFSKIPGSLCVSCSHGGKTFKTYLEAGTEQEVCLEMLSSLDGQTEVDEPLYVLGEADTLADAVHKVFAWLTKRMGVRTREQKAYAGNVPLSRLVQLGCFLQRNHRRKSPSEGPRACGKKIPVRWMLMDDGWLSTKGELLCDFAPEPAKFPNGFGKMIADIKAESDIRWFGVWHALCGYWQGIAPESKLRGRNTPTCIEPQTGKSCPIL